MTINYDTLLVIQGIGIPQWSARGLSQTLFVIPASINQRRTINGALEDLSYAQFRKYASKITCTDRRVPAIDGIYPGATVTVHCVAELCHDESFSGSTSGLSRPQVSGSDRFESDFTFYRPILQMQVTNITLNVNEWGDDYQWEIDLEEI
jgi:hypothetical protein